MPPANYQSHLFAIFPPIIHFKPPVTGKDQSSIWEEFDQVLKNYCLTLLTDQRIALSTNIMYLNPGND